MHYCCAVGQLNFSIVCIVTLSILSLHCQLGFKSQNPQTYKPTASSRQSAGARVPPKRSGSSAGKLTGNGGMGTRSISVGTLNQAVRSNQIHIKYMLIVINIYLIYFDLLQQSDSDPDAPMSRGGILRPTIASQNKVNGGGHG